MLKSNFILYYINVKSTLILCISHGFSRRFSPLLRRRGGFVAALLRVRPRFRPVFTDVADVAGPGEGWVSPNHRSRMNVMSLAEDCFLGSPSEPPSSCKS